MFRMVTVPLDQSTDGDRALAPAVVLARQFGVALEFVVVSAPGLDPSLGFIWGWRRHTAQSTSKPLRGPIGSNASSFLMRRPVIAPTTRAAQRVRPPAQGCSTRSPG